MEAASVQEADAGKEGGLMVKVIWKHKEELVEEPCRKAGIRDPKDWANVAKMNTSDLGSILMAFDPAFKPFVEHLED